ncbi:ArnT family glycosyltransferase [Lachnotalea glycerini]|uniref:Glycosyltransferase RgtA/B/C/D-like domain-containing protein n=1 Tax=Lachnotalea glycerini TaxID=1763509 RepID=A0A371JCR8_9FIRM|nr:glycosyltransferase family 39 protein [Lachnotalea glycerini]RDY30541.1 hypothetical protein CG710_014135 [Lachnotalea glycerini]
MKLETYKSITLPNKTRKIYQAVIDFTARFYIPIFILLSGILFFLCFYHLDAKWVSEWDEARHGINAYEMYQNNNLIVNTFNYSNDYWNLKPPLSYWCIMLSFKLFGFHVFSLRFYSALCYFITCVAASLFVKRQSHLASLFTMAFFCASGLAFVAHMARAGDADALYTMLFTFAMLAMMSIHDNKKMLYVLGLCFSLAFLTKSWHSGMIVVIGALYLFLTGELNKIKKKEWLLFLLSFSLPLLLWATARFMADGTSFFNEMLQKDLLNRTSDAIEGHNHPFAFYYDTIFKGDYIYKAIMIICLIGAVFFNILFQKAYFKKFIGYLLWFFIPFLAFSAVKTKLVWYVYPALIPLTMVAGIYTAKLLQTEQILFKVKWVLLVIVSCVLIKYTHANITEIRNISADPFQSFIEASVTRDDEYAGANAYVFTYDDKAPISGWTQDNIFLAEISGDYRCKDGGMDAFLQDQNESVLYISKDYYVLFQEDELKDCQSLFETTDFILLKK